MKTNVGSTKNGKVKVGGMYFYPDEPLYFIGVTAERAFWDKERGRLVVKDCKGNYAHSCRKFKSEAEFNRVSGWSNF